MHAPGNFTVTLLSRLAPNDWLAIDQQSALFGAQHFVRKLGRYFVVEFRHEREFQFPTMFPRKRDALAFAERVLRSEACLRGSR